MHFIGTAIRFIHFIDHHDRMQIQLQGFLQYETGLRHRTFKGIHQQNHPIGHFKYTLHLTSEIGVARGIDHIDLVSTVHHRSVLGKDGDAALTFQVVTVHDQLPCLLVFTKNLCGVQDLVHQGCFSVVNVGDNGYVSDIHVVV